MKCERCGKSSNWKVKENGDEIFLCGTCLDRAFPLFTPATLAERMTHSRPYADRCPHCGTERLQLKQTALVGCPLCYEVFAELLSTEFGLAAGPMA